jgi:dextranase
VLFNAVGNWPIEALAASPQDFAYIEVWPPATAYRDLREIVAGARSLSGGKPVVMALYLPADRPANIRLADALIFSCGGSRIELGEGERLLADPYFPKHQPLAAELRTTLRRYYDFAVRYEAWLGPAAPLSASHGDASRSLRGPSGDAPEIRVDAPDGIWSVCRAAGDWLIVCLVNMTGLDEPRWDEPQPEPTPQTDVSIRIRSPWPVGHAWWGTPDRGQPGLQAASWSAEGDQVRATLPFLDYWAILAFQLEATSAER